MIINAELLNKIRHYFKLNMYEAKTWAALLSRGKSIAGELAEISEVPRSRTYDVLETLEKKGFIMMKLGKPISYIAIKPRDVIEKAKHITRIEADDHVKRLGGLVGTDTLNELDTLYKQGVGFIERGDLTGSIRGRQNAYLHMDNMLHNAKSSVCMITSAKGLARKHEMLKQTFKELSKKGVNVKIAAPITKESSEAVKELTGMAEIRHLNNPKARFCIVDNKEVMFMLVDDDEIHANFDVGVWASSPYFAKSLGQMFDLAWQNMEDSKSAVKRV